VSASNPSIPRSGAPLLQRLRWNAHRAALALQRARQSVWIVAGSPAALLSMDPLLLELRRNHPSYRLQILVHGNQDLEWAETRYPNDGVLPVPFPLAPVGRRFRAALNPRLIVEAGCRLGPSLRPAGVPIVEWPVSIAADASPNPGCDSGAVAVGRGPAWFAAHFGWPQDVPVLAAAGVPDDRLSEAVQVWLDLRSRVPDVRLILEPVHSARTPPPLPNGMSWSRRSAGLPAGSDTVWADRPGEFPLLAELAGAIWIPDLTRLHPTVPALLGCRIWFDHRDQATASWIDAGIGRDLGATGLDARASDLRTSGAERARRREAAEKFLEPHRGTASRLACRIAGILGPPETGPRRRQLWEIPKGIRWLAGTAVGKRLARIKGGTHPANWQELAAQLGTPRTVLCLGNGPSSEDPLVRDLKPDLVLRVNWRWKQRGFHVQPGLVFVGDPHTIEHLPGSRFVVADRHSARILALRALALHPFRSFDCICLEDLPRAFPEPGVDALPSGGAYQAQVAVNVRPDRIVLAGFDLFADDRGRYPGDLRMINDYAAVHRREDEITLLAETFRHFAGELYIVGEPLREALAARGIGACRL
jgi:hypothetical protein